MRDEFTQGVKDELARRVSYLCSNPGCRQQTSGPQSTPSGSVNIGVAAHITAASPGGPRYDESILPETRGSAENGIWLCQICAKLVDNDPARYDVSKLQEWKSDAESAAARALEHRTAPATESQGVFSEAERLMPDLIAEMRNDVRSDETELVRELVILHSRNVMFGLGHSKPRFVYYTTEYPNITVQADWLEETGCILDITPGNAPIYRMVPEFVDWLRGPI